jgi:hypothetical protein
VLLEADCLTTATAAAAAAGARTNSFGGGNCCAASPAARAADEHRKAATAATTLAVSSSTSATTTAVGSLSHCSSSGCLPERGLERANTQSSMDCGSSCSDLDASTLAALASMMTGDTSSDIGSEMAVSPTFSAYGVWQCECSSDCVPVNVVQYGTSGYCEHRCSVCGRSRLVI